MTKDLIISLWATNLSVPVSSIEDWISFVEKQVIAAKAEGADVFLMPEYAAEQWLHFAPAALKPTEQPAWMASQTPKALPFLQNLAKKHDLLLISGTFPAEHPAHTPPIANRAHLFFPDGKILTQNKLCLTPKEKNPEGWMLSTGKDVTIFDWRGFKMAVLICLDIELPALSAKIANENIDLVLVPSMTKKRAGYHRVFDCAKARAVELQAAIAVVGAIGGGRGRDPNISGASIFIPCEESLGHTGKLAEIPPSYQHDGAGPILTATLPLTAIRTLRQGTAEVWPGAWKAEHVCFAQIA